MADVLLTCGVPIEVVSEILGRSSVAITGDVHGHVAPDVSRGAVPTLDAVLGRWERRDRPQLIQLEQETSRWWSTLGTT
jgi:integrase